MIHDVRQDDEPWLMRQDTQDKKFNSSKTKQLHFGSVKSVTITQLESSSSQGRTCTIYQIDSRANGNVIPFKTLFLKSTVETLHAMKNNVMVLKHIIIQN